MRYPQSPSFWTQVSCGGSACLVPNDGTEAKRRHGSRTMHAGSSHVGPSLCFDNGCCCSVCMFELHFYQRRRQQRLQNVQQQVTADRSADRIKQAGVTAPRPVRPSHDNTTCGWPLNDGSRCAHVCAANKMKSHHDNHPEHSNRRATQSTLQRENGSGIVGAAFKRPRSDTAAESHPTVTSSTRSVPLEPSLHRPATTSSTHTPGPFEEYRFHHQAGGSSGEAGPSYESGCLHEEQAQQGQVQQPQAVELMAGIAAAAAAQATTAALQTHINALILQLQDLPQALAREVPAAVREHDEAEAERLSSEALDSSLQKQIAAAETCVWRSVSSRASRSIGQRIPSHATIAFATLQATRLQAFSGVVHVTSEKRGVLRLLAEHALCL